MTSHARISILALIAGVIVAAMVPAAAQAAFGVESFFAGNCNETHKECNKVAKSNPTKAEEVAKAELEGFPQAAGHPNWGITDFTVSTAEIENGESKKVKIPFNGTELATVRHIRTDVAPGVSTNPQAVPKCSAHDFGVELGGGIFLAPTCPTSTEIGINKVVVVGPKAGATDQTLEGKVYNLEQTPGLSSLFGVALEFPKAFAEEIFKGTALEGASKAFTLFAHTLIEGGVEYASDYHDFFEIKVSETLPLVSSRLTFKGNIGGPLLGAPKGAFFLTNPTSCTGPGPQTTTTVAIEDTKSETGHGAYESPVGSSGCESVAFAPTFSLTPETTASDLTDGVTVSVATTHPEPIDSSDLRTAVVKLPEGMTMNPAAASGLEGCTPAQIGIGTRNETKCPTGSRVGTAALEVPGLPAESLKGFVYLGKPASGPITAPPYTIYLDAESTKYNVKVRLKGTVEPNPTTGQLTATFVENPEQPFTEAIMHFNGGAFAPIANPLVCGTGAAIASFTPFSGFNTPAPSALVFTTSGCAASGPPFAPTQSAPAGVPMNGGTESSFTFTLTRPEGNQYIKEVSTVLPPGLVAKIPSVPLCAEAQANAGTCPAASLVGTVRATAGSGEPYPFTGRVYLTGPYNGAPYGLSIAVPLEAGPFNLGTQVTRAKIAVNPNTARVVVSSVLPVIGQGVGMPSSGIPVRLRSLTVSINRPNYILNPTNCGELKTESTVTSTLGATALISSPFQAEGCSGLAFKPAFSANTGAKHSKTQGASLVTTLTMPGGNANMKSVFVTLPKQLPSRLTTLQKACLAKVFEANPLNCKKESPGSEVGTATAVTPVLPNVMKGPAFLVSHAGESFPSLELVLEADGVQVIVEGKTDIKKGITTTNFASTPDVPVSSITVNLPLGPHSALTTENLNTNLCTAKLTMPTILTGQNGKVVKQNTTIKPTGCGVQIVGRKVVGNTLYLTLQTYAAGRISGSGKGLKTRSISLKGPAGRVKFKLPLSGSRRKPFSVKVRVGFVPKKGAHSTAFVTVRFP